MYAQSVDTGVFCAACQIVRRNCFTEAVSWSTAQAVPHGHTAARAGGQAGLLMELLTPLSQWDRAENEAKRLVGCVKVREIANQ